MKLPDSSISCRTFFWLFDPIRVTFVSCCRLSAIRARPSPEPLSMFYRTYIARTHWSSTRNFLIPSSGNGKSRPSDLPRARRSGVHETTLTPRSQLTPSADSEFNEYWNRYPFIDNLTFSGGFSGKPHLPSSHVWRRIFPTVYATRCQSAKNHWTVCPFRNFLPKIDQRKFSSIEVYYGSTLAHATLQVRTPTES